MHFFATVDYEAGVDMQVISHGAPALQRLKADVAVPLAPKVNDKLAVAVKAHPTRFAGFAALPTADPKAAADEMQLVTCAAWPRTSSLPVFSPARA